MNYWAFIKSRKYHRGRDFTLRHARRIIARMKQGRYAHPKGEAHLVTPEEFEDWLSALIGSGFTYNTLYIGLRGQEIVDAIAQEPVLADPAEQALDRAISKLGADFPFIDWYWAQKAADESDETTECRAGSGDGEGGAGRPEQDRSAVSFGMAESVEDDAGRSRGDGDQDDEGKSAASDEEGAHDSHGERHEEKEESEGGLEDGQDNPLTPDRPDGPDADGDAAPSGRQEVDEEPTGAGENGGDESTDNPEMGAGHDPDRMLSDESLNGQSALGQQGGTDRDMPSDEGAEDADSLRPVSNPQEDDVLSPEAAEVLREIEVPEQPRWQQATQPPKEADVCTYTSGNIVTSVPVHPVAGAICQVDAGCHSCHNGWKREFEQALAHREPALVWRALNAVRSASASMGRGHPSPRHDGRKLIVELATRRASLSRARRREVALGQIVCFDVSTSMAFQTGSRLRERMYAAIAQLPHVDPSITVVTYSNTHPQTVYGAPVHLDKREHENVAWWRALAASNPGRAIIMIGDAHGQRVFEALDQMGRLDRVIDPRSFAVMLGLEEDSHFDAV